MSGTRHISKHSSFIPFIHLLQAFDWKINIGFMHSAANMLKGEPFKWAGSQFPILKTHFGFIFLNQA